MDLRAYAARIGYAGDFSPTLATLSDLHFAHATHIPFENIEVLMGGTPALDVESLERKLVLNRRGGYCFEQNSLFAAALEECGFRILRLAARVRWGARAGSVRARTHMLLAVDVDGEAYVADVGFGGDGLLFPLRLHPGAPSRQGSWSYRIVTEADLYVLQAERADGWLDLYSFTLEPQHPVDYQVANWYTSTWPTSTFRNLLRVQMPGLDVSTTLVNRTLTETTAEGSTETTAPDEAALMKILLEKFGLRFPEGTRIPLQEAASTT